MRKARTSTASSSAGSTRAGRRRRHGARRRSRPQPGLREIALELLDELDALPRPLAASRARRARRRSSRSPIPPAQRAGRPRADRRRLARPGGRLRARQAGREHLARGDPRDREGNGQLAGDRLVHGASDSTRPSPSGTPGTRRAVRRASPRTSTAIPEDDDLNFTMLGVLLLERCGADFDEADVAKLWLDYLPAGRIFTAERVALRNLLEAYLPPETATRRNPFREWVGARLRVDAYGWAAAGDPVRAARMAWHDARVSHTANGVYAAMFMAAAHAASLGVDTASECADVGLSVDPALRAASPRPFEPPAASTGSLGGDRRSALRAVRRPARRARDQQHGARRRRALRLRRLLAGGLRGGPGRLGHRHERRCGRVDLRRVSDPIDERWSAPLHGRFASSLPTFDGDHAWRELVDRTLAVS